MKTRIVFFFQGICWFANFFANVPPTKKGFQKNALVTRSRFFGTFWMLGSLEKTRYSKYRSNTISSSVQFWFTRKGHFPQQTKNDNNSFDCLPVTAHLITSATASCSTQVTKQRAMADDHGHSRGQGHKGRLRAWSALFYPKKIHGLWISHINCSFHELRWWLLMVSVVVALFALHWLKQVVGPHIWSWPLPFMSCLYIPAVSHSLQRCKSES